MNVNGKDSEVNHDSGILEIDGIKYNEANMDATKGQVPSDDGKNSITVGQFQGIVADFTKQATQAAKSPLDDILGDDASKILKGNGKNGNAKAVTSVKAPEPAPTPKAPEAPKAPVVPEAPKPIEAPKAPQAPKPIEAPKAPEPPKPTDPNEGSLEDLMGSKPAPTQAPGAPKPTSAPKELPYVVPAQDAYRVKDGVVQAKYAGKDKAGNDQVWYLSKENVDKVVTENPGKIPAEQATELKLTILAKELENLDAKPANEKNLAFLREYQTKLNEYNALAAPKKAIAEWDARVSKLEIDLDGIETIIGNAIKPNAALVGSADYLAFDSAFKNAKNAYVALKFVDAEAKEGIPAKNIAQKIWSNLLLATYKISQGNTGKAIEAQKPNLYGAVAKVMKAVEYALPKGKEGMLKEHTGAGYIFGGDAGVSTDALLAFYKKNIGK